jgi:hypothetical protein
VVIDIFVTWATENETFDPQKHLQKELIPLRLEIGEEEGQIPYARMIIANEKNFNLNPKDLPYVFIALKYQGKVSLLFKGCLVKIPKVLKGEVLELEFLAEPLNFNKELRKIANQKSQEEGAWDQLFYKQSLEENPHLILEGAPELFFVNRTSLKVSTTGLLKGHKTINISKNYWYDSLQCRFIYQPLDAIKVTLSAEWIEKIEGYVNFTLFLRKKLNRGVLSTLTGEGFKEGWWKSGQLLGQSGYWIEDSHLEEINPPYTGALGLYPVLSKSFWVSPEDPLMKCKKPWKFRIKRSWFRPKLILGWRLGQRRREKISFSIKHKHQLFYSGKHYDRLLNIKLQNICADDPLASTRDSFFNYDRGRASVYYGMKMALAHLVASARCLEVKFEGDFFDLLDITTDHMVRLDDPRLPGGSLQGKVKSYRLILDGKRGIRKAHVVLGVSVGINKSWMKTHPVSLSTIFVDQGYCSTEYLETTTTPQWKNHDFYYDSWHQQKPTSHPLKGNIAPEEILEQWNIENLADEQNRYLQRNQYPQRHSLKKVMEEVSTRVSFRLKPLMTQSVLEHNITIDHVQPWSSIQQIHLR